MNIPAGRYVPSAVVKRLSAIQNFGAMDVLCTDKTGTLTQDRVILQKALDLDGGDSREQVFARLSPTQKATVVAALQRNGHVVGFLGDGINDGAGLKTADVGISVDCAVDIAKESAGPDPAREEPARPR